MKISQYFLNMKDSHFSKVIFLSFRRFQDLIEEQVGFIFERDGGEITRRIHISEVSIYSNFINILLNFNWFYFFRRRGRNHHDIIGQKVIL